MRTEAYTHLSVYGRAALLEFLYRFNGANNGEIQISVRQLGKALNCGKNKAVDVFLELQDKGWIKYSNKNCKSAKPPLMLHVHRGKLLAKTMGIDHKDHIRTILNVSRKQLIGKWHDLVINSKLVDKNHISYSIQSKSLGINKTLPNSYMLSCGTRYIKLGIYRTSKANIKFKQSLTKINDTSVIQFDDIKLLKK
tara:strand:- start:59 stop:643 length:585 start_codon:yes stop_codon:yes gene_type:complete